MQLPEGVEAGFRLVITDAFGGRFSINVYGAGRKGWFTASLRGWMGSRDVGPRRLVKGQWRTLLNFVKQCRFWELPASLPERTDATVEDGAWLALSGREGERYHHIDRFIWREPGLDQLQLYLTQVSGLFPAEQPDGEPAEEDE